MKTMQAELLKLKGTPYLLIHVLAPVLCAIATIIYGMTRSTPTPEVFVSVCITLISIGLPFLSYLIVSVALSVEADTLFFPLLSTGEKRWKMICRKLMIYLGSCLGALLFSYGLLVLIITILTPNQTFSFILMIKMFVALFLANIISYIVSIFIYLTFGQPTTIVIGGVRLLVSALFLTGMGDIIWQYTPASWGVRIVKYIQMLASTNISTQLRNYLQRELSFMLIFLPCVTFIVLFALMVWYNSWEGRAIVHE